MTGLTADEARTAAYETFATAGLSPAGHLRASMLALLRWRLTGSGDDIAETILSGAHSHDLLAYLRATMPLNTVEGLHAVTRMSDDDIIKHCRDALDIHTPDGKRLVAGPQVGDAGGRHGGTNAAG